MAITTFPINTLPATGSNVANVPASIITATDTQAAINQLAAFVFQLQSSVGTLQANVGQLQIDVDALQAAGSGESGIITTKGDGHAIADGASHPLSSAYATLAAAQAVYPFATSLLQEIDYCACQLCSNLAFGVAGAEHADNSRLNKPLRINAGTYQFGTDTWRIRNLKSGLIYGDGKLVSIIQGGGAAGVMVFDGVWYTKMRDFSIQALNPTPIAALEIDGNVPGHPYTTRGVQAVVCDHMQFAANGGQYGVTMVRQGGNAAQGSECAFIECHFIGAAQANYFQNGFNSLDNKFVGGDMQGYSKYGIECEIGTISVYCMSFEPLNYVGQYLNGGWDILLGSAGVREPCMIDGCRTEGLRFLFNTGSVEAIVQGCMSSLSFDANVWQATHAYGVNDLLFPNTLAQGRKQIFRCTTAGNSGGVQPVWPAIPTTNGGSVITDGTVTWHEMLFMFVYNGRGSVDRNSVFTYNNIGDVVVPPRPLHSEITSAQSPYYLSVGDTYVGINATSGPVDVYLPFIPWTGDSEGSSITVKRIDGTGNTVTLFAGKARQGSLTVADDLIVPVFPTQIEVGGVSAASITIPANGYRILTFGGQIGGSTPSWWRVVSTS